MDKKISAPNPIIRQHEKNYYCDQCDSGVVKTLATRFERGARHEVFECDKCGYLHSMKTFHKLEEVSTPEQVVNDDFKTACKEALEIVSDIWTSVVELQNLKDVLSRPFTNEERRAKESEVSNG